MWEEVRKFGLEYCDLPTMLWNVAVFLRVLTLNIDNRHNEGIPFHYYVITLVSAACYFYVYLISMLWFVFWSCLKQTGDIVPAMVVLSLGVSSEIGILKLVYMFLHIDKIRKIAEDYLECDSHVAPNSRFSRNLLKSLRNVKKRATIYWMVLVGNGVLYLLKPMLTPGTHLPEDYFVLYGLEPAFESPNFEITWLAMIAGVLFICYVPANVTAYLIVIAGYTESQMLALSEEMLHLWTDALKEAEENEEVCNNEVVNQIVSQRLKDVIKQHAIVLNLYKQVEDVFRGAIAMGFIVLIIGLIVELLGGLENTYLQMPFAYMQVAMDCFTGQRVIDASVTFERAIYECKWENFDRSNMKMVQVMLQNSQKTMSLSAGGITNLSYSCLMTVTRAIYSAYTTLRTTMSK